MCIAGAPLHTLSKSYDVPVGFVHPPPYFEAEYCLFCGRRRVAVARYRMICLVLDFYDLSAWCGCWFVVYIRRFIYKFLNVCPFDYTVVAGSGKVGP